MLYVAYDGGETMTDANQHQAVDTGYDSENHQQSATTHNTVNADVATTVVQAGVITGGVHNHLPAPRPPRQLIAAPTGFVGRADQLATLDRALTGSSPRNGGQDGGATAVISAIGGIGKTWLALTWANRNLHRFPDGHLSVDLRGFSPGEPRHPADVLAEFLAALGVDRDHQPTDLDARIALYRTHTTGKRLLILLDNAATADQVEPLLPGGTSCTVLATSRHRLDALLTNRGAHPVRLDVLTDTEARTLLASAAGDAHDRADAERAITELIGLCKGFPLALGLIAARIRSDPDLLHDFVADLRDLGLDALDSDVPAASLPAVLSWSLRRLTDRQHTVFGLMGIAPGPDIGIPAVCSLAGLSEPQTRKALRDLEEASLLDRRPGGRYVMHDLVRDFATDTAHHDLPEDARAAGLRRVVDFYLYTADNAERLLDSREPIRLDPPEPNCLAQALPDYAAALAWLDTEQPNLLAAQHTAATHGWHQAVWNLAQSLTAFHHRRGSLHDLIAVWQAGLAAAEHLPAPSNCTTLAHRNLGDTYAAEGRHEEAIEHLHQALTLAKHHHDLTAQAHTHFTIAIAWERWGNERLALQHATHALSLFRTLDDPVWEAASLNAVGRYVARFGDYERAHALCQTALTLHRHHHDPAGEARALENLAYIHHHTSDHHQAISHYQQALTLFRDLGHTYGVAGTLNLLGEPHAALRQHERAQAVWREALELYRAQQRTEDAERIQQKLDDLDNPSGGDGLDDR
ncbi:ATP-binding protein [Kutzneria albida]|uniref:Uncharacterized protein n=1 Tax=Kutzneria albida DSM 43870 TaxID=1449976 RepID=W5WDN7_9PSEU|nr:tetratricopeptide repeat protein [Kutzneria albida]AHH98656.1 hypothetical protein KALB_5294 [Kutzneria albida DSM 43870]